MLVIFSDVPSITTAKYIAFITIHVTEFMHVTQFSSCYSMVHDTCSEIALEKTKLKPTDHKGNFYIH